VTTKLRRIDDDNGGEADEITLRELAEEESGASATGKPREASP
jgi:hypothetical protein